MLTSCFSHTRDGSLHKTVNVFKSTVLGVGLHLTESYGLCIKCQRFMCGEPMETLQTFLFLAFYAEQVYFKLHIAVKATSMRNK